MNPFMPLLGLFASYVPCSVGCVRTRALFEKIAEVVAEVSDEQAPAGPYAHAREMARHPVLIKAVAGRTCTPRPNASLQSGPGARVGGEYAAKFLWRNAGVGPEDMDLK